MTKKQWQSVYPIFKPSENWGDPKKMDYVLIWMLHRLRRTIGKPFIIHCGYETEGHAPNSYHKKGEAVDFYVRGREEIDVPEDGITSIESWCCVNYTFLSEIVNMFDIGVGIYPYWNNPGFHFDLGDRRIWWQDEKGKYRHIG